ncbi:Stk1 family PASTA domain-containing Ser/Thr kinase [Streptomyces sp. NPDC088923]|uniref:Stk1 family PASTA domain-containing Ser/Thr kinase n=1 Tax=Streptomyces sp. NPDC088923 TaxID=3365913 RepID=UPI003804D3AE
MDTRPADQNASLLGKVLDGRYRVDALIAAGGMSTVHRAVDLRLDRVVALKVMHPELATDAVFVERFIREAKSVARLDHPNVVSVFDQNADGAFVYLAMEYVPGCTLRDVLRERGALSPRAALDILEPVLAGLGAAHRAGLVHRDMKPENVLIGDDGRVKVADFGLVRGVGTDSRSTGAVLGTVSYLAPEQISDEAVDERADVYACGIVLFEMLTGGKPHLGDSPAQVLYQHLNTDVPAPSGFFPALDPAFDTLVAAAAAREPAARPRDAVALLAAVRHATAHLDGAALDAEPPAARAGGHDNAEDRTSVLPRALTLPRPGAAGDVSRTSVLPTPTPAPAPARTGRPRRRLWSALVVAVVVLCGGAGVWYVNAGQFTEVPRVLAKSEKEAKGRLDKAGLRVKDVKGRYSATEPRGTVLGTDPAPGARIRDHGEVALTVSLGPRTVDVPRLTGKTLTEARAALRGRGLDPGLVTERFDQDVSQGAVIDTEPQAGENVKAGSTVRITVSRGAPVDVPEVSGKDEAEAREELSDAGLDVKVAAERVFSSDADEGAVAKQSPSPGKRLAAGDTVTLTLSKGPDLVEVPDVEGKQEDEAKGLLEDAGFEVKVSRWFLGHTVWDQSVSGGDTAPRGSTVTIRVR